MLLYIQENKEKNAVGETTATVDKCVSSVGNNKRTVDATRTFGHKLVLERKAVEKETTIIAIGKSVVILKECNIYKEGALNFLNGNIPDLIFVDCYLNTMNSRKLVEIIRMYKELAKVPIIYIADPSEMSAIAQKLPEGVVDIVSRPVKRGDLQKMLDTHITDDTDSDDEVIPSHDIIS